MWCLVFMILALANQKVFGESMTCDPGYYTCGSGETKKTSGRCACPIMEKSICHSYMTEVYNGRFTVVNTENTPDYAPGCYVYSDSSVWLNYMEEGNEVDCTERDVCICKKKSCDPCPKGKYSLGGVDPICLSCGNGTYTNDIGQVSCKQCGAGLYQDQSDNTDCKLCPPG